MYLCKNGVGIGISMVSKEAVIFELPNVHKNDSGNYSCVYSKTKHSVNEVTTTVNNCVIIQVKGTVTYKSYTVGLKSRSFYVRILM